MPTLTLTAATPLVAEITIDGTTVRDADVTELSGGLVAVEFGGPGAGVRLVGRLHVVHALIIDADRLLTRHRRAWLHPPGVEDPTPRG